MITGIIAVVILIAVLPPAVSNGEWGVVAIAVIAALFLLALGASSRRSDRAYLNWTRYWANGGPNKRTNTTRDRKRDAQQAAEAQREWKRVRDSWREGDEYCPACRGKIGLAATLRDGRKMYMCTKCGKTFIGELKR